METETGLSFAAHAVQQINKLGLVERNVLPSVMQPSLWFTSNSRALNIVAQLRYLKMYGGSAEELTGRKTGLLAGTF